MPTGTFLCAVSGQEIPSERIEALRLLGVPERQWTRIEFTPIRAVKGLMVGNDLLVVDSLGKDGIDKSEDAFLTFGGDML